MTLYDIEKQLSQIMHAEDKNWLTAYRLLRTVSREKLWKQQGFFSFTEWLKDFAVRNKISESVLWRNKHAGDILYSYCEAKGKDATKMKPEDREIRMLTPGKLELAQKISKQQDGKDDMKCLVQLTDRIVDGKMSRSDLQDIYESVRGTRSSDKKVAKEFPSLLSSLQDGSWLGISKRTVFERRESTGYKLFTELGADFALPTGCVIAVAYNSKRKFTLLAILLLHEGFDDLKSLNAIYSNGFLDFADEVYIAYRNEADFTLPEDTGRICIDNEGHASLAAVAPHRDNDSTYRSKILEKIIQKLI